MPYSESYKNHKRGLIADDILREHLVSLEDLVKEKYPEIHFDLLSPEDKEKATDKLAAFDNIVKPQPNQKQEHHTILEEAEYKLFYQGSKLWDTVTSGTEADLRRELNI